MVVMLELEQWAPVRMVQAVAGGAGAGIGGNGGKGGNGNSTEISDNFGEASKTDCGTPGEAGENCGKVNIYNSLTVYAYGGAGGSGGISGSSSGGGAGGYPGAGIGGGRSWRGPEATTKAELADILGEEDQIPQLRLQLMEMVPEFQQMII